MAYIIELKIKIEEYQDDLKPLIKKKLNLNEDEMGELRLIRKSLDARKKPDLYFQLLILLEVEKTKARELLKKGKLKQAETKIIQPVEAGNKLLPSRPVIVGSGPAGIFCAYKLAAAGLKPIIIERGAPVEERVIVVEEFMKSGYFDESTNVAFGEGGAGTFSDGKLTTRSKSPLVSEVYKILIEGGASTEILYQNNPHLGTDGLRCIVIKLRKMIESMGGSFRFKSLMTDFKEKNSIVEELILEDGSRIPVSILILAIGHSARDTSRKLIDKGLPYEAKPFSVGARIEHPTDFINQRQYGRNDEITKKLLGNSEYHLTYKGTKGVYSFCMCPGGMVVPSNSFKGEVVTNGMSYASRGARLSNSAIVATVNQADFGTMPLEAMEFQESIERKAFSLSGDYRAVGQNAADFIRGVKSQEISVGFTPSYRPGIILGNLWDILPEEVCRSLREGLIDFDRKLPGFIKNGFLTGPETRTSSPVRIIRDENCLVLGYNNIYAIGEGAGYAGGIVSSAIDGLRLADKIIGEYKGVEING